MKDLNLQVKLINQALAAAQASIELSKQLLADLSGVPLPQASFKSKVPLSSTVSVPGIVGTYDGESMVTDSGEKFPVPPNYASKTLLVFGDKLKMVDGENGEKRKMFKQIERVKRRRVTGLLSKKDSNWLLVTSDGSHRVLEASVAYHGFKEGDHLVGLLPQDNVAALFAALEGPPTPRPTGEVVAGQEKAASVGDVVSKPVESVKEKEEEVKLKAIKKPKIVKVKKTVKKV